MESKLKKKSLFKRIIKNQLIVTVITGIFLLTMIIGSSYAVFNQKVFNTENDVVVQSGNLEVVISNQSDMIEMNYTTLGVPDEVGLTYNPYSFTVENTGKADIAYYEIRIVDKEYEISTLPHKSLNFAIAVNNSDYQTPQNLGDNDSYIYVGNDLKVGETDSFNLKLWVNEEWGKYANNKTLKASIEVTLYSENPTRNYIVYDTQGGSFVPKTSVFSKRVTQKVPLKLGYEFLGWSTTSNGNVEYESNAIYQNDTGIVLYAIYEEATITYDLNGGIGSISSNKISQGIATAIPTKAGYNFIGWSINKDAEEAEYQSGEDYFGNSIILYAVWVLPPKAAETIIENVVSYSVASPTTFTGGLVAINTDGTLYNETDTSQTIREYRYSGPNVNNYIYFNCKDNDGTYDYGNPNYNYNETNCELWRIVGIFKNNDGNWNLKLVRNTILKISELVSTYTISSTTYKIWYGGTDPNAYWNSKTSGTDDNDWTTAGLQYFLNTNEDSNGTKGYYSKISLSSKSLIDEEYTYYLGNVVSGSSGDTTITAYNNERNGSIHAGNQLEWNGAIGLLYSSDVGYAAHNTYWSSTKLYNYNDDTVNLTNWICQMLAQEEYGNEWLISPSSSGASSAYYYAMQLVGNGMVSNQTVSQKKIVFFGLGTRPVLNLKSETTMLMGDGTQSLPYVVIEG